MLKNPLLERGVDPEALLEVKPRHAETVTSVVSSTVASLSTTVDDSDASLIGTGKPTPGGAINHHFNHYMVADHDHDAYDSSAYNSDPDIVLPSDSATESARQLTSVDLFGCRHQWVVALFFTMAFFTYFDRGALSAALDHIQEQLLNDSSFKGGCLASCYLFGFCLSSPVFALLGSRYSPLKMSGLGMLTWSLGCALTGLLSNFYLLMLARLLTGIGEASFLSFASTIIDVAAPQSTRAFWIGIFYMAISFGFAIGFAGGGAMISSHLYHADGDNQRCVSMSMSIAREKKVATKKLE